MPMHIQPKFGRVIPTGYTIIWLYQTLFISQLIGSGNETACI